MNYPHEFIETDKDYSDSIRYLNYSEETKGMKHFQQQMGNQRKKTIFILYFFVYF
jgi:hypothetical protein